MILDDHGLIAGFLINHIFLNDDAGGGDDDDDGGDDDDDDDDELLIQTQLH